MDVHRLAPRVLDKLAYELMNCAGKKQKCKCQLDPLEGLLVNSCVARLEDIPVTHSLGKKKNTGNGNLVEYLTVVDSGCSGLFPAIIVGGLLE